MRIGVTLVLALGLAACQAPDPGADGGANGDGQQNGANGQTVVIDNVAFGEQEISVPAGTTVTWVNEDNVAHTVTHGEDGQPAPDALFDEPIATGQEVTFTFEEPGTYPVTCTIHPAMNMTVVVE